MAQRNDNGRATRFGLPLEQEDDMARRNNTQKRTQQARKANGQFAPKVTQLDKAQAQVTKNNGTQLAAPIVKSTPATSYAVKKLPRYSEEKTEYDTLAYRIPRTKSDFKYGDKGPAQEALVLDIDGTLQGYGQGLVERVETWIKAHVKRNPDIVLLVITAREHEFMYETSFNWLMRHLHFPFIGPFCRADDDPRLASEFKRQLAQGFEDMGLYKIVGAADDNVHVNKMWKHWKATKDENFDLLECSYGTYGSWRSGLDGKYYTSSSYGQESTSKIYHSDGTSATWVNGHYDNQGTWVSGHWSDEVYDEATKKWVRGAADEAQATAPAKHRAAGERTFADEGKDLDNSAAWAHYLNKRYGAPTGKTKVDQWNSGLNVVSTSPNVEGDAFGVVGDMPSFSYVLTREELEVLAYKEHPDWTPEYMAQMTNADLREEAGITNGEYREMLYEEISDFLGYSVDGELEVFDIDEIEPMLDLSRQEILNILDTRADMDTELSREAQRRHDARIDLEDLVLANRTDLILPIVEQMDIKDLEAIIAEPCGPEADRLIAEAKNNRKAVNA